MNQIMDLGYKASYMKLFAIVENHKVERSQGDGWRITTDYGFVDYVHNDLDSTNEVWWIESHKRGHGSELLDLMMKQHPADTIAWGVTSHSGKKLRDKYHKLHPEIYQSNYPHDGQFDPSGNNYGEDLEYYD